jgi:hypothetical protein
MRESASVPNPSEGGDSRGRAKKGKCAARLAFLNNFVDFTLQELTRAELAVWLVLFRDSRGGVAETAMSTISRRAGCSKRAVVTAIKRLRSSNKTPF